MIFPTIKALTPEERFNVRDIASRYLDEADLTSANLQPHFARAERRRLIRDAFKLFRRFARTSRGDWLSIVQIMDDEARQEYRALQRAQDEAEFAAQCEERSHVAHVRQSHLGL